MAPARFQFFHMLFRGGEEEMIDLKRSRSSSSSGQLTDDGGAGLGADLVLRASAARNADGADELAALDERAG
jgi:hypothetical protein